MAISDFLLGFSELEACRMRIWEEGRGRTLMLPIMSFLTGVKAIEPRTSGEVSVAIPRNNFREDSRRPDLPKSVVSDSEASRKSVVGMALSLLASTGTPTKDFLRVSNHVPPAGKETFEGTAMIAGSEVRLQAKKRMVS